jgi:tetratricopeptide (TPR) repeat protein
VNVLFVESGLCDMNLSFEKARILYLQRRFDLASRGFRDALAADPTHANSQAMLALCLWELNHPGEAIKAARAAVALDPEESYCLYVMAHVFFRAMRLKEARTAIEGALAREPANSMYLGQRALIELNSGNWSDAIRFAQEGLAIHPEELACLTALVRSLDRLGRKEESKQVARDLLRVGVESEYAHVNAGWSILDHGDAGLAIEHFKEALRINPNLAFARLGLVEALKCQLPGYRSMRSLIIWVGSWARRPLTFLTGLLWLVFFIPITTLAVIALFLRPLYGATLRFNRYGYLAMTRDQVWESNLTLATTLLAIQCIVSFFVTGKPQWQLGAGSFFGLSLLIPIAFRVRPGWPRWIAFSAPVIFALAAGFAQLWMLNPSAETMKEFGEAGQVSTSVFGLYVLFFILAIAIIRLSRIIPRT